MNVSLNINGFAVEAHFDDESVQSIFLPLLRELSFRQKQLGRRMIVLLAAPPGAGKSTLAAFLEQFSRSEPTLTPIQALGMDGFHFHQDYILSHTALRGNTEIPMQQIKGAPESFDVKKLWLALENAQSENLLWPYYDRRLHDVVEDAVSVSADILLIEGNWLLLDQPDWRMLAADFRIFIDAEEELLYERLILRKMRGGSSPEESEAHYLRTDGPNIRLCRKKRLKADLLLSMIGDGQYEKKTD